MITLDNRNDQWYATDEQGNVSHAPTPQMALDLLLQLLED
jgi:hypothetical protein